MTTRLDEIRKPRLDEIRKRLAVSKGPWMVQESTPYETAVAVSGLTSGLAWACDRIELLEGLLKRVLDDSHHHGQCNPFVPSGCDCGWGLVLETIEEALGGKP